MENLARETVLEILRFLPYMDYRSAISTSNIFLDATQLETPDEKRRRKVGSVFVNTHSYRGPDVYRIIGRTAKRVIVEEVALKSNFDLYGGSHYIDTEWLENNPPIYVTKGGKKAIWKGRGNDWSYFWSASLLIDGEYHFEEDPYLFYCQSVEY